MATESQREFNSHLVKVEISVGIKISMSWEFRLVFLTQIPIDFIHHRLRRSRWRVRTNRLPINSHRVRVIVNDGSLCVRRFLLLMLRKGLADAFG